MALKVERCNKVLRQWPLTARRKRAVVVTEDKMKGKLRPASTQTL
jgi:hypothetical protein